MAEFLSDFEKSAKRTLLYNEISAHQRKIDAAHSLIRELRNTKRECASYVQDWNRAITRAKESAVVSKIEVAGKFEGVTAHKYASSLPRGIKDMTANVKKAKEFEHAIGLQIRRLEDFISRSANNITALSTQISQI